MPWATADNEKVQEAFRRHWDAFMKEIEPLTETLENRETIHEAIKIALDSDPRKATGLGAAIAHHWEPIMVRLLSVNHRPKKLS
jgi:hypothetical protein